MTETMDGLEMWTEYKTEDDNPGWSGLLSRRGLGANDDHKIDSFSTKRNFRYGT